MECNRDEAARAKDIAVKKLSEKDAVGAKKFALKAQNLFPDLEGLPQLLSTVDVYIFSEKRVNGEVDWYGVLGVDPIADDDTIRKHYRKLALILHPDKNKLIGADGAFKLISEAWSLLSDKAKRSAYDQKRFIRGFNHKAPTTNVSVPAGRNGFHNFPNGAKLNATNLRTTGVNLSATNQKTNGSNLNAANKKNATFPKPAPAAPRPPSTFWTVCDRCKMQYEYLINYLNHTLLCPNCHEPFLATKTPPPPLNGRQTSIPWTGYQNEEISNSGIANMKSDRSKSNPAAASNIGRGGVSGSQSSNKSNAKSDSGFMLGSSSGSRPAATSSAAQAGRVVHPAFDKFKRGREDIQTTSSSFPDGGEKRKKKSRTDETTTLDSGKESINETATRGAFGIGGAYATNTRTSITRDMAQPDIRNLLMMKAKTEIQKKLNEWRAADVQKSSAKFDKGKMKEKQETAGDPKDAAKPNDQFVATANKVQQKLSPFNSGVNADMKDPEPVVAADVPYPEFPVVAMDVPDPDFHDFDSDRTEKSFAENQVWAAYDDDDGMPRYYAMIHGVISKRPFKMRISWLNSKSNSELAQINWTGCGFQKTGGDFRVGKHEYNNTLNSFSHKVKWAKGARGIIHIYPCKGEVWALYRNWSPDWNELTPDEVIHKYDMFEVLEDYAQERGVTVTPLVKVAGFKTVFRQHMDPKQVKTIPKEELFRFSHQVPSYLLTGQEAQNAPKGCRELDPAATPLELLQVTQDIKGEEGIPENAGRVTDMKETVNGVEVSSRCNGV